MPARGDSAARPTPSAAVFVPPRPTLQRLQEAAASCTGCALYRNATQTVFGEGPADASVMLLGEQPGDQEDRLGAPFVGPAGRLLDEALEQPGIDRDDVYVTNTVKHFKWEPRGKRRIHKKPNLEEISACRPWLDAELSVVQPLVLVCLGATAAQAMLGRSFRVTQQRGEFFEQPGMPVLTATVHPSSIVRVRERDDRQAALSGLVADLRAAGARAAAMRAGTDGAGGGSS